MTEKKFAHDICPAPKETCDGPADVEPYLRYQLVRSMAMSVDVQAAIRGDVTAGDPEAARKQIEAVNRYIGEAHPALLMLRHLAGDTPGEAARYAHNALCDGATAAEVIWDALTARGIDPDSIRGYAEGDA